MTTDDIKKNIKIREFLHERGIYPIRENDCYGMYYSPLRTDNKPSFKVDYNRNLWFDFGTGEGGSIIDLVAKLEKCSIHKVIQHLENNAFSFHRNSLEAIESKIEGKSIIQMNEVKELTNPILLDYLKKRSIDIGITKLYCKEIHYSVHGKPYFAIGFPNDSGGWVIRSPTFKGCTSMDVKTYHTGSNKDACLLFEGFMDFLSYLTLKREQKPNQDAVILNSVINLPKAIKQLSSYSMINAFLDNDESGRRTVLKLQSCCKQVNNLSANYSSCKDLNDYLCERSKSKVSEPKKRKKGIGL